MIHKRPARAIRIALLSTTLMAMPMVASHAGAQALLSIPGPPVFSSVDEHGVNVADGSFRPAQLLAGIGPSSSRLQHVYQGTFLESSISGGINTAAGSICGGGGCTPATMFKVSLDGASHVFARPDVGNPAGIITTAYFNSRGQSLSYNSSTQVYTHVDRDGTINLFSKPLRNTVGWATYEAVITSRQFKDGETWAYTYVSCGTGCNHLSSIKSNRGYMLKYDYTGAPLSHRFTSVTAINTSVDYCDAGAGGCSYSKNWPKSAITYIGSPMTGMNITDELGRTTQYYFSSDRVTSITSPQGVQKLITYDTSNKVASVQEAGVTWTYSYGTNYTRVHGPDGQYVEYTVGSSTGDVSKIRDRTGNVTSKSLDTYGFASSYIQPEGNRQEYTRDGRANVTQYKAVAKLGSGLADVLVTEAFPSCASNSTDALCNKPITHTAAGQTTDMSYHAQSGMVSTITRPAATAGGIRPETRMSYGQVATYEKNSAGSLVQAGTIWVLTGTSACNTVANCVGTADERKTILSYAGSNNALPTSFTEQSGNGAISRTRTTAYDPLGNPATVDGFLPGAADTTAYKYNDGGELVGTIGPDPDGAGPLPN